MLVLGQLYHAEHAPRDMSPAQGAVPNDSGPSPLRRDDFEK